MATPPLRDHIAGTPSNAVAKTAFGALYDYVTGLLGATGNAAEARAALGAAGLAGATFTGGINEARGTIAMHATTMDIWALPNVIDGTGAAVTITAIANAPQAGASRTLYPLPGTVITHNAMFAVDGGASYTSVAGDGFRFEAVTASTYKVRLLKNVNSAGITTVQSWTAPQRVIPVTDNDLSFDLNAGFAQICTPTAGGVLTYTNIPAGAVIQSGVHFINNTAGYAITAHTNTKISTTDLAAISAIGMHKIGYDSYNGNVYVNHIRSYT